MTDQIETRIQEIRRYNEDILADENTRSEDADKASDTLWLIDQLAAARESIRNTRAQEREDQDTIRYLESNPPRPHVWPPATPENTPSLTDGDRKVANAILSREGQPVRPLVFPGPGGRFPTSYTERQVSDIMARYYNDQAQQ